MKKVVVSEAVEAEVATLLSGLAGVPKEKIGVLVVKSFKSDKKLNDYLAQKWGRGLKFFTDKEFRDNFIDSLEFGIADETRKKALIIGMLKADAKEQVKAKIAEVTLDGTLVLSKEQQEQLEKTNIAYEHFLSRQLDAACVELGLYVGAFETEKEPAEKEAAIVE